MRRSTVRNFPLQLEFLGQTQLIFEATNVKSFSTLTPRPWWTAPARPSWCLSAPPSSTAARSTSARSSKQPSSSWCQHHKPFLQPEFTKVCDKLECLSHPGLSSLVLCLSVGQELTLEWNTLKVLDSDRLHTYSQTSCYGRMACLRRKLKLSSEHS